MAKHTLPNIGLTGGYTLGEDGWGDEQNANLLKLSTLVQGGVLSREAAVPGSPAEGDVVILTDDPNENAVAVYDNGDWVYFEPSEGWLLYDRDENVFVTFNGTEWEELATGGGGGGGGIEEAPEDGEIYGRQDAAWVEIPSGGGGGGGGGTPWYFDPPTAASFTETVNGGITASDDADIGLTLEVTASNGDVTRGMGRTIASPDSDWVLTAHIYTAVGFQNNVDTGLMIADRVAGKAMTFGFSDSGNITVKTNYIPSGHAGRPANFGNVGLQAIFLRIVSNVSANTYVFQYSTDGKNFVTAYVQSRLDFLTNYADFCGLGTVSNHSEAGRPYDYLSCDMFEFV